MDSGSDHKPYLYNAGLAFTQAAASHAHATALYYPDGTRITFRELEQLSNRIAHMFAQTGIRKGDVVCIFSTKSVKAFACMLACLKLGAPYANLDVSSPSDRIRKMLDTCRPAALVFDDISALETLELAGYESLIHDLGSPGFDDLVNRQQSDKLTETVSVTAADPAYIMFTSGSTGFPKGAVMSHGNVINLIEWARVTFGISSADVFTNVNPIYFDNSVFDFYSSLFNGATLCPVNAALLREPRRLVKTINELGCTIWFSVPSLLVYLLTLRAIGPGDFASVTRVAFGGEGFPKNKLRELYGLLGDRARLINVYGPTECTCICSSHDITQDEVNDQSRLAPLGRMAPNFGYRIDPFGGSDPNFGELLIAGPNVGLGYFNDAARTIQSFIQDLDDDRYRSIVYRTGDLVRLDADGLLHFCGRADNQIKHMGYRIELEEIEAAFSSLDYIDEVAVMYRRNSNSAGSIVAFVGCLDERPVADILADVGRKLPPYMIPGEVRLMEFLPKNANGKIDRARLNSLGA